jgi:hypothetical protein
MFLVFIYKKFVKYTLIRFYNPIYPYLSFIRRVYGLSTLYNPVFENKLFRYQELSMLKVKIFYSLVLFLTTFLVPVFPAITYHSLPYISRR